MLFFTLILSTHSAGEIRYETNDLEGTPCASGPSRESSGDQASGGSAHSPPSQKKRLQGNENAAAGAEGAEDGDEDDEDDEDDEETDEDEAQERTLTQANKDAAGPEMEGLVKKRGRINTGWQQRYFVVRHDTLKYFKTKEAFLGGEDHQGVLACGGMTFQNAGGWYCKRYCSYRFCACCACVY